MRPRAPWLLAIIGPILWIAVSATQADARLEVDAGMSIQAFLTDNVSLTENNKEEDLGTSISPRLGLRYETKNIVLGATYIGTAEFFVNNTSAKSGASTIQLSPTNLVVLPIAPGNVTTPCGHAATIDRHTSGAREVDVR